MKPDLMRLLFVRTLAAPPLAATTQSALALNMNDDRAWNAGKGTETEALTRGEVHGLPCHLRARGRALTQGGRS